MPTLAEIATDLDYIRSLRKGRVPGYSKRQFEADKRKLDKQYDTEILRRAAGIKAFRAKQAAFNKRNEFCALMKGWVSLPD